MEEKFNRLMKAGICIDDMIENLGGNTEILEVLLCAFLKDKNYEKMKSSLEKKDYAEAFLASHTLKGVFANLGMKSLQNICSIIVEKLRNNDYDNLDDLWNRFDKMYHEICSVITEVYNE